MKKLNTFQRAVLNLLIIIIVFQLSIVAAMLGWGTLSWILAVGGLIYLIIRCVLWIIDWKLGSSNDEE